MKEQTIFTEALERQDPAERATFLDQACAGNPTLRDRIERLLQRHEAGGRLLEPPATPPAATLEEPPPSERPGTRIGPYKLREQIGEGGFGVVFMADQTEPVRRKVALKILKPGMDTRHVVARFEAERQVLAIMDHPNIAKVHDGGATGGGTDGVSAGRPYFVMELVKGVPITEFCDQNHLTPRQRLELFIPVCQAVQHAHQKGIIHRDLKPSNILVTRHDTTPVPKVIDFGIAKALGQELTDKTLFTGFAQMMGTPAYMSPEQAGMSSLDIDTRSDIYSLGVLLYELLTGVTPFGNERFKDASYEEIRRIIREEEPPKPSTRLSESKDTLPSISAQRHTEPANLTKLVRGELDWIVMKALDKDRNRRYETANAFALDVQRYLADEPVLAGPPSAWYRFRKVVWRNRAAFGTAAVISMAVLAVAVIASLSAWMLSEEQQATQQQLHKTQQAEAKAKHNSELAEKQRLLAQQRAEEHRQHLVRTLLASGVRRMDEGDLTAALLWFTDAFRRDQEDNHRVCVHRQRLGAVLQQMPRLVHAWFHDGPVTYVDISPDGRYVVTAGQDATARIWNVYTGEAVAPPLRHGHSQVVVALFNSDGRRILTASLDKTACVWDATTGQLVAKMVHGDAVNYASFSADGTRVVTACEDGSGRVWDAGTGQPISPPLKHPGRAVHATFSPDGKYVAICSLQVTRAATSEGESRVWDAVSGKPISPPLPEVVQAWFHRDSPSLLTVGSGGTVDIWHVPSFTRRNNAGFRAEKVAFSPDGRRVLAWNSEGEAMVYWGATGRPAWPVFKHASAVVHAAFSPDGEVFMTACLDGTAWLWSGIDGKPIRSPLHHAGEITHAVFSPNNRFIVTTSSDHAVRVWDLDRQPLVTLFEKRVGSRACFSPDGRFVLATHGGLSAKIVEVATCRSVFLKQSLHALHGAFSPDGQHVLLTFTDGTTRVWDAKSGDPVSPAFKHDAVVSASFSPDGKQVVTASRDGTAGLWHVPSGERVAPLLRHDAAVNRAVFSPDGLYVVTAANDSTARIWDAETGASIAILRHTQGVAAACFSPDSTRVVTACADGAAHLWSAPAGQELTSPLRHGSPVHLSAFSPNGRQVVTASADVTARVWDATTGQAVTGPLRHGQAVTAVSFSSDSSRVLTASRDGTARVWDAATGEPLTPALRHLRYPVPVTVDDAAFSPDGCRLVTADSGAVVRVWDLAAEDRPMDDLVLQAQLLSGSRFDDHGVLVRLEPAGFKAAWSVFRAKYPAECTVIPGPALLAPPAGVFVGWGAPDKSMPWDFSWAPVPQATSYQLSVVDSRGPYLSVNIPALTYRHENTMTYTGYQSGWKWRVRALVNGCWTDWSEERALVLGAAAEKAPKKQKAVPSAPR